MLRSGDHLRPRDFKSFPGKTGHKTLSGRDLPSDGATFPGQHWIFLFAEIARVDAASEEEGQDSLTFVVLGDPRLAEEDLLRPMIRKIKAASPDFVLITGDCVMARGSDPEPWITDCNLDSIFRWRPGLRLSPSGTGKQRLIRPKLLFSANWDSSAACRARSSQSSTWLLNMRNRIYETDYLGE